MHQTADSRQETADGRQQAADSRQQAADSRQQTADNADREVVDEAVVVCNTLALQANHSLV